MTTTPAPIDESPRSAAGPALPPLPWDSAALKAASPGDIITVVTGLPRSGTSLMMQVVGAAGLPLLAALPRRIRGAGSEAAHPVTYRVIFMEREMDEILASQRTFLGRLGEEAPAAAGADVAKAYRQQVSNARNWCLHPGVHALAVSYEKLVREPDQILPQLAEFLGAPDRIAEMRACIDPALYRERKG